MNRYPAIVIGGPPHSGKSVLTYALTQRLRRQGVLHYVLRACPDGEGDWSNEAPPDTVRMIRSKGRFTGSFVDRVCRHLAHRHLPLLVDVGGNPQPDQEAIFDPCTHAVLLAHDTAGLDAWRERAQRHGLLVIAELISTQTEGDAVFADAPPLRGRITGLERGRTAAGPTFDALYAHIERILRYPAEELRQQHLRTAPCENVVDAERPPVLLGVQDGRWSPADLVKLLDYLPAGEPLALYGRGPAWLYAALTAHVHPAPFFQFDTRSGWVEPIVPQLAARIKPEMLRWNVEGRSDHTRVGADPLDYYLDYDEMEGWQAPPVPSEKGVVISGKLPHWLVTGLVDAYLGKVSWIGVFQPQLEGDAVVVWSHGESPCVGDRIASPPQGTPDR